VTVSSITFNNLQYNLLQKYILPSTIFQYCIEGEGAALLLFVVTVSSIIFNYKSISRSSSYRMYAGMQGSIFYSFQVYYIVYNIFIEYSSTVGTLFIMCFSCNTSPQHTVNKSKLQKANSKYQVNHVGTRYLNWKTGTSNIRPQG
jgi:hypothetical protein